MSLRDSITRSGGGGNWRRAWRRLRRPGARRLWLTLRARWRTRRALTVIEAKLAVETPTLASMFDMFNHLTAGEAPGGVERVPSLAWPRRQPAYVAVMLALAAIATLCLTLSLRIHPSMRPCLAKTSGATAYPPVRALSCPSYGTNKSYATNK